MSETAPKPIIHVENFRAAYGGKTVMQNLNFDIMAGEVFVIGGGSGCGKSTLPATTIGLYTPADGKILIDGDDLAALPARAAEHSPQVRRRLPGRGAVRQHDRPSEPPPPMEEYTDLSP
jgi:ABC-type transporter Mla maintaining outer membrane lipid asymmetry ATPase subunit MlaF